jgi:hypothetical protein
MRKCVQCVDTDCFNFLRAYHINVFVPKCKATACHIGTQQHYIKFTRHRKPAQGHFTYFRTICIMSSYSYDNNSMT